ncbi:MAG: STAS/SEC14 domain-containing protein [Solirubrobacterales bacterium]
MLEQIAEMPPGTIGFRASGALDVDEYRELLMPAIDRAVDRGSVRILFAVGPDFERFDPATIWADAKHSIDLGVRHRTAWERTALATDVEWISRATQLFAWMVPGEIRVYGVDELDAAKIWLAA